MMMRARVRRGGRRWWNYWEDEDGEEEERYGTNYDSLVDHRPTPTPTPTPNTSNLKKVDQALSD
jgi:hypothetical protein